MRREPALHNELEFNTVTPAKDSGQSALQLPDKRDIADRAYQRWLARGCPEGSPEEDWFEAERELRSEAVRDGYGLDSGRAANIANGHHIAASPTSR